MIINNKILFLGESHWMTDINKIITDVIFYANTKDYFPTLIFEIPFSATAFVNAYIDADSNHAARLLPIIKPFFKAKESLQMLATLKDWNQQHPQKKISVACSDMEQGFIYSLKYLFDPIF